MSMSFKKSIVSINSSSVSPGKPTITSTPIQQSSRRDLICFTRSAYNSRKYFLRIVCKTRLLPDCKGIWKCGTKRFESFKVKSIISLLSKFGSIDEILNRSIPSTLSNSFTKPRKFSSEP